MAETIKITMHDITATKLLFELVSSAGMVVASLVFGDTGSSNSPKILRIVVRSSLCYTLSQITRCHIGTNF